MIRKTVASLNTLGCQQSCKILLKLFLVIILLCAVVHQAMAEPKPNTDISPPGAEQGSGAEKVREEEEMETNQVPEEKDEGKSGQTEKKTEEEPPLKDAEQPTAAAAGQGVDEEGAKTDGKEPAELPPDGLMDTDETGTADKVRDGEQPKGDAAETAASDKKDEVTGDKPLEASMETAMPSGAEGQAIYEAQQMEGKPHQNKVDEAASTIVAENKGEVSEKSTNEASVEMAKAPEVSGDDVRDEEQPDEVASTADAEHKGEVSEKSLAEASMEMAKPPEVEKQASGEDPQMGGDQPKNADDEASKIAAENEDQASAKSPSDASKETVKPSEAEGRASSEDPQMDGDQPKDDDATLKIAAEKKKKVMAEPPEAESQAGGEDSQMDGVQEEKRDDAPLEAAAEQKGGAAAASSSKSPVKTAKGQKRHNYEKGGKAAEKQKSKKNWFGGLLSNVGNFFGGQKAQAEEDYNFPTDLAGFGMEFNKDGELRDIKTGERFQFKVREEHSYNQRRYEALGEIITEHVYGLLEKETNLKRKYLPLDPIEGEPRSFIFVTDDADTNPDKLMILIHGSGVVRAGQWARRLIINDNLQCGTQLPFIKRAVEQGYGVMVLNTNLNYVVREDGYRDYITKNESPEEHTEYVWSELVSKYPAKHIAIVAHSYGGVSTTYLASQHMEEFSKRVFAIAFTDSVHSLPLQGAPNATCKLFNKIARNWVASDLRLDTDIPSSDRDAKLVSAGHRKHEWTSWSSFESIFKYFQEKYEELTDEKLTVKDEL